VEILQIVAIGIIAGILAVILKQQEPGYALMVSITAGVIILLLLLGNLSIVIRMLVQMANRTNINTAFLTTVLKVIGIAYLTEFGAQVCKDAGEGAVASKIELGGKVIIMVLAIPILSSLMEVILKFLP
jgi:stage III sporulation protein AD